MPISDAGDQGAHDEARLSLGDILKISKENEESGSPRFQASLSFLSNTSITNNLSKIIIVSLMAGAVMAGIGLSGYKYLDLGFHCREELSSLAPSGKAPKSSKCC